MNLKRIAGAAAGLALLLGGALPGPVSAQGQPQTSLAGEILERLGAARDGTALELAPTPAQPSEDEIAVMHMLLQLLMMQQQEKGGEHIIVPSAPSGVAI